MTLDADYRWPAEWEEHRCTWCAWPVNRATWPGLFERIPGAFARFVANVARFEPVRILLSGEAQRESAYRLVDEECGQAGSRYDVSFVDVPVNDSWCRDYGPIFLAARSSDQGAVVDWDYNSWGGKYPPWDSDAAVARQIAELLELPRFAPGLVLEGGAIEGDGRGTVLTTEACLLNPNRNGPCTRQMMEDTLRDWMNASRVIWLPGSGILGDDTDGHVDQVARFIDAQTVVVAAPWTDGAPEADDLRANRDALAKARTAHGSTMETHELRLPEPKFQQDHRLPASYCNFIFVNGGVIVPTFRDKADAAALELLQRLLPDHEVVGVDALELVWGLGAFHCLTQQQPLAAVTGQP